jgi:regulation of enolase protein 1 (concanavalin A-like superfamily)
MTGACKHSYSDWETRTVVNRGTPVEIRIRRCKKHGCKLYEVQGMSGMYTLQGSGDQKSLAYVPGT